MPLKEEEANIVLTEELSLFTQLWSSGDLLIQLPDVSLLYRRVNTIRREQVLPVFWATGTGIVRSWDPEPPLLTANQLDIGGTGGLKNKQKGRLPSGRVACICPP